MIRTGITIPYDDILKHTEISIPKDNILIYTEIIILEITTPYDNTDTLHPMITLILLKSLYHNNVLISTEINTVTVTVPSVREDAFYLCSEWKYINSDNLRNMVTMIKRK